MSAESDPSDLGSSRGPRPVAGVLCALALGATVVALSAQVETPRPVERLTNSAVTSIPSVWKGPGSCSASACHGSIARVTGLHILGNEHTIWITTDPHARAYEVLGNQRSLEIERRLARGDVACDAREDVRCLACHSTPSRSGGEGQLPTFDSEGVSCEACHGAAGGWLAKHTTNDWRGYSPEEKSARGFRDLSTTGHRARACALCHVGAPANADTPLRDVNHDLIAPGHPRLNFENAAFQDNMPRHWEGKTNEAAPDFAARQWLVGQVACARASLDLLANRAAQKDRPWPEFSESSCFSCHHSLKDDVWRRRNPHEGAWRWSPWPLSFRENWPVTSDAGSSWSQLANLMNEVVPDRTAVAQRAQRLSTELGAIESRVEREPLDAQYVAQLIESLNLPQAWESDRSWDHSVQRYLALVPLLQSWRKLDPAQIAQQDALETELSAMQARLRFPDGLDSPRDFAPSRTSDAR